MHTVQVLFFATLRDRAGVRSSQLEIPAEMTVSQFKERIAEVYPALEQSMDSVVIAVNHEFAFDETIVPDHAEVALFPPVSGG